MKVFTNCIHENTYMKVNAEVNTRRMQNKVLIQLWCKFINEILGK